MSDADTIAQKLDLMRADVEEPGSSPAARLIAGHAALLLAAIEAVLAKADEWSVESAGLEGGHRGLADHGADKLRTAMYARSVALKDCADQLREVITRELAKGEGGTDGS